MASVLTILKIIGLILLGILALVLILVLLVLFVPYGYRLDAAKDEKLSASARVTWLFHAIAAEMTYSDGINLRVRLFGIPLYDKKRREARAAKKAKNVAAEKSAGADAAKKPTDTDAITMKDAQATETESDTGSGAPKTERNDKAGGSDKRKRYKARDKKAKKSSHREAARRKKLPFGEWCGLQLERFLDGIASLMEKAEDGLEHLGDTLDNAIDTAEYYIRVLTSEGTAWVAAFVKKHIGAILRQIKPSRFDADIDYRSTDPVQIAKVMEYYALSLPFTERLRGRIRVTALPEQDSVTGTAKLKGHFFLGVIAWHALRIVLNRKVKRFLVAMKREGGNAHQVGRR